ncbi:NAC domain [Dillenia turbinata]|uniref:NAC domain n=1 Tax=Dillenia turbinata TaxID=194707 RepID=A0AAN8VYN1_9MAGN
MKISNPWPPGFRFHPTDEELILYYLKRKICGRRLKLDIIAETDVYKWTPEELPGQSELKTGDRQWFFFSPRDRKYPNGARSNRATKYGYWKATGKDRKISCNSRAVGVKKTLVYYKGRAPHGERTDWVMHEYTLDEDELKRCQNIQDYYVLYKLFKKSGPGPKNGEQYGAPFREEDWADEECAVANCTNTNEGCPSNVLNDALPVYEGQDVGDNQLQQLDFDLRHLIAADEPEPIQICLDDYIHTLPEVAADEVTQSTMVNPSLRDGSFINNSRSLQPCVQQPDLPVATQSDTSQLQAHDASEVTSVPSIFHQLNVIEEDFLEMDDLLGPEPAMPVSQAAASNLPFEELDGLNELDLFQDVDSFLQDMGIIDEGLVTDPLLQNETANYQLQSQTDGLYQMQTNTFDPDTSTRFVSHDQRPAIYTAMESIQGSIVLPNSGMVCGDGSSEISSETKQNQSGSGGGGFVPWFSSSLWAFVDSIPTNPASASENPLVNRALERMSSFGRVSITARNTNNAASSGTITSKPMSSSRAFFYFFSLLGVLCALLWFIIGTSMKVVGRYISS